MHDFTSSLAETFERHTCGCHECITYLNIVSEQDHDRRLRHAIDEVAEALRDWPSLWERGDGKGGYVAMLLQGAMERRNMNGYLDIREPRTEVVRLADRDGWDCAYCGTALAGKPDRPEPHVDHVIPKSRGGSNGLDNKVLACPKCNIAKGARTPAEWRGES